MKGRRVSPLLWYFDSGSDGPTYVLAPFAGGSAYSLADWPAHLLRSGGRAFIVHYPGRGPRLDEPPASSLGELAQQCVDDLQAHSQGPLVLVGHSLGGVLCHEIALRLERIPRDVELLAVSAARYPGAARKEADQVLAMTRTDWLRELEEGGQADGTDPDLADLLDVMIPVLRADYLLLARHRPSPGTLSCPVLGICGSADPWVATRHRDAWARLTDGRFSTALLPGGHFYYRGRLAELGRIIVEAVAAAAAENRPPHDRHEPGGVTSWVR